MRYIAYCSDQSEKSTAVEYFLIYLKVEFCLLYIFISFMKPCNKNS